jgi:hypothetical protein
MLFLHAECGSMSWYGVCKVRCVEADWKRKNILICFVCGSAGGILPCRLNVFGEENCCTER